jgi:hypothetical protein
MINLITTILALLAIIAWIVFAVTNISILIPFLLNIIQLIWLVIIFKRKL